MAKAEWAVMAIQRNVKVEVEVVNNEMVLKQRKTHIVF